MKKVLVLITTLCVVACDSPTKKIRIKEGMAIHLLPSKDLSLKDTITFCLNQVLHLVQFTIQTVSVSFPLLTVKL